MRIFPPFLATSLLVFGLTTTNVSHAQGSRGALDSSGAGPAGPARGAASLERAQVAWNNGEFDTAEVLYREALDQGGLPQKDTLEAYVFMGAARAVQNKREPALVSFRQAALIDPKFKTPPEAGKKANQLAEVARRQQAKFGPLTLKTDMPQLVPAAQAFPIDVGLDPSQVPILSRVGLSVNDGLGQKPFVFEQPAATRLHFSVPGNVAVSEARLVVKIVGLDAHDNQLVTAEGHVQVQAGGPRSVAIVTRTETAGHAGARGGEPTKKDSGSRSFWATPWPYVIGGVALAGAGAGVYLVTRPPDQVNVTAVRVQAVR